MNVDPPGEDWTGSTFVTVCGVYVGSPGDDWTGSTLVAEAAP